MIKSALSLNGGAIGILLTASVFGVEPLPADILLTVLLYCMGLVFGFAALGTIYFYATRVLGNIETYQTMIGVAPYDRLKTEARLLRSAHLCIFLSVCLFFAGTLSAALSVSDGL